VLPTSYGIWYIILKGGGPYKQNLYGPNNDLIYFRILFILFCYAPQQPSLWIWISTNPFCCLVLTVASKAFAAGADILEMQENPGKICLNE
jgi:hypothetical protein